MDVWETITMKDMILAMASAAAAVIGVVLVEILFGRRTYGLLEKHKDKAEHNKESLSKEHNNLSKEHIKLSEQNITILNNQKVLSAKQDNTSDVISEINNMLHEDKIDQKYLRENMNEHQQNMKESFDNIQAIFDDWKNQIITIDRLQERLHERDREIERLERENRELQREREHNRGYDRGR